MKANILDVFDIFNGEKIFFVPLFQRKYVWGRESQWNPLWDDIENLANTRLEAKSVVSHFLGAVILKKSDGPIETDNRIVIDGQQRFVTLHIATIALSRAIKAWLSEEDRGGALASELEEIRNTIEGQTINSRSQGDNRYKIHLYDKNFEIIKKIVDGNQNTEENSILLQCYSFFLNKFLEYLSCEINPITERANSLLSAISKDILICRINLEDLEDEYEIFETINDRGTPLTVWDKAKNYIVSRSSDNSKSQEEFYIKYLAKLDEQDWWYENIKESRFEGTRIERLFSHWVRILLSKEVDEYIQDRRLYHFFRNHLINKADLISLVESFGIYADLYYNFETQNEDNSVQGIFCNRRKALGAGIVTPLMLKLHEILGEGQKIDLCTRIIESYLMRRVIAGHDSRAYNKLVHSLIRDITLCEDINSIPHLLIDILSKKEVASDYWPNNDQIIAAINDRPMYGTNGLTSQWRLKIVLKAIDHYMTPSQKGAIPEYSSLEIEHIMPQSWEKHWKINLVDEQNRREAIHKLGNLTIVNKKLNPVLSNKAWEVKKKEIFSKDNLFINKELTTFDTWNEDSIHERGEKLAERICEIWPHADAFKEEIG